MPIGIALIVLGVIIFIAGLFLKDDHGSPYLGVGIVVVCIGIIVCVGAYIIGRNHVSDGELKQLRRNTAKSYPQLTVDSVNAFDDGTGRAQVTLAGSQCTYVIDVVTGDNGLILVQGTATSPNGTVFIAGNFAKNTSEECAIDPFTSQ